jgi:TctA family transporter
MSVLDLVIMAVFGLLGVFMKIYGWPRPPVIIAIVLGEQLNQYFWLSINSFGWRMFERPQMLAIMAICIIVVWLAIRVQRSTSETVASTANQTSSQTDPKNLENPKSNP